MQTFNIKDSTVNVNPPTQQELNLESKEVCTFRIAPKLHKYIKGRAEKNGIATSKFIESVLLKYFKSEPELKKLYAVLDDVIGKNF